MRESYEFEDVVCSTLRIGPLNSLNWTVEIDDGGPLTASVIMTTDDLRALAEAAKRLADQ